VARYRCRNPASQHGALPEPCAPSSIPRRARGQSVCRITRSGYHFHP
jgi:hypothetical protein